MYIENPAKTENPKYLDYGMGERDIQQMQDVMEFAMTDERASEFGHVIEYATDGTKTERQLFVSALNCAVETARQDMMMTKQEFDKLGGNTAYHAIQSFKPGEVTPEVAHEIGMKLAQELWGERFEVVIATHIDKSHIHNHFILNSVSFVDGIKFHDSRRFWRTMARTSDRLCREYSLSVVENPKSGATKHYLEHKAEREGKLTWRSFLKSDIDQIIAKSMTENQFLRNLLASGYKYRVGKYLTVITPSGERHRLETKLGDGYSLANIKEKIHSQQRPKLPPKQPKRTIVPMRVSGNLRTTRKHTGFRALYVHYLFLLGKIPKNNPRSQNPNRIPYSYRADLRKLDRYAAEIKLLANNRIYTSEQLAIYKEDLTAKIEPFVQQRKTLYKQLRGLKDEEKIAEVKSEIKELSTQIRQLRREVKLCDDIAVHTQEMKQKMKQKMAEEKLAEKSERKEKSKNEPTR